MGKIMWLRIILTGLSMELIYGMYISFIRWYEPTMMTSLIALGFLMMIGGYLVGIKANSDYVLQGALVGLTGVVFYIIILKILGESEEVSMGHQFWLEHIAKIAGGAIGGYIALKKANRNDLGI